MKTYWRSLEELEDPKALRIKEAREEAKQKSLLYKESKGSENNSRRDFLRTLGFSLAAASIVASCKKPVEKAIPYLVKPEEIIPGQASYYASSYFDAGDYCSVVVKVRDGRPIKIEGNELSPISQQGTSARVQASILNLYDGARYKGPRFKGKKTSWDDADKAIATALKSLADKNEPVVLLASSLISPSTKSVIDQFIEAYPNVKLVQYDSVSASGMLSANLKSFGQRAIPDYRFDQSNVVVSFGADFLGTWLSPVEYTKHYTSKRKLDEGQRDMLRHYQFESAMSLTGSNADVRFPIKPSEEGGIVLALYNAIAKAKGASAISGPKSAVDVSDLAEELLANQGQSIVVSGSNDEHIQLLVNGINQLLGNYGKSISWNSPLLTKQGLDAEMNEFVTDLKAGKVKGLLAWGVNPVYDHPEGMAIETAIRNLELSVSFAERKDETANLCQYILPEPNYLESWNDHEPKLGSYSLAQPTIQKLFDSRNVQESLLRWMGDAETTYADLIKKYWEAHQFTGQTALTDFRLFWNTALQKGVYEQQQNAEVAYSDHGLSAAGTGLKSAGKGTEVVLYETIAIGNGKYANNPWLQELPDPMAKISWDNYASVPVAYAEENGLSNESVITVNGLELPVFIQPGQAAGTIAVALGYGRSYAGKVGDEVGKNMFSYVSHVNGARQYYMENADVAVVEGKTFPLALSQTHHSMEGRPIARETNLDEYLKNPAAGNEWHKKSESHHVSLYEKPEFKGHHWGMAIDLNSCTGCGNCAISCQAENNVQVIGKEQVRNRRIMHWIRVDRYYSGDPANPEVSNQPVMCQHCDNAPCENVCPVAATPHSEEGLNQMAYNRCVGTKYCINNCPYRVRRFNWFRYVNNDQFDYNANNDLGRMVLNPDVTVRSRGVVEKCSMCVQRIQEKKQEAKLAGRMIEDGEIKTACQQSCPGNAIVFGDLNNPESKISKLFKDERNYHLLEELHTLPSVGYLTKVRNKA
ncbi:TAT-variant-translocated molybdopterin oxidoreductase [Sunxiuqinia elliptica]|uniref:Prokaryotic molybdopterin-containing oxidoreductase family, iron-sulfur binding subunit n=1 Tax=Sunxiuqinia elliptica TaxID=655355 RepID=A0A1I2KAA6_9BACT|nr:TAT-variant-translocated molybdopterin oxidoreductase [Sunxiuqinia elliptica]SFF63373.1 prokaryotic molybdopterin-containing oxidoreductase family, iron-sulfur binding subunit [Sunxiuqinia elliptica]